MVREAVPLGEEPIVSRVHLVDEEAEEAAPGGDEVAAVPALVVVEAGDAAPARRVRRRKGSGRKTGSPRWTRAT